MISFSGCAELSKKKFTVVSFGKEISKQETLQIAVETKNMALFGLKLDRVSIKSFCLKFCLQHMTQRRQN